jgi:signal transduction histidine kinase
VAALALQVDSRITGTTLHDEVAAEPLSARSVGPRPTPGRGGGRGVSIAAAVVQFAIIGVAILFVVSLVAGSRVRDTSTQESLRDARELASLMANEIVGPKMTPALMAGEPTELAAMDAVIDSIVGRGTINRVKVYTPEGVVVYSDEHLLIGQKFPLEADVVATLTSNKPVVLFTDLSGPENAYERDLDSQLEVYMPMRLVTGETLIYEHYQHTAVVSAGADEVTAAFSPLLIRSLIALELLQLPLAWWLARRVRESQRQRAVLLQSALDASDGERRRIAQDLHDGIVQDLAGVSFAVDAVRHDPSVQQSPTAVATLDRVVDKAQASIRGLRTLLVDIYPPNLESGDLEGALADLLAPFEARGVHTEFRDEITGAVSSTTHGLMYRTAREALRNVEQHAAASTVSVVLRDHDASRVEMVVTDDGMGFHPAELGAQQADGHFGVRLLGDVARAAGGELLIESTPGNGTRIVLVVPR